MLAATPRKAQAAMKSRIADFRGRPMPHAKLLHAVWGPEYGEEREYLRTFILQLRRKLEDDPSDPAYLKTVAYIGYVFSDPTAN